MRELSRIQPNYVRWSNELIFAANQCSLLERRLLYWISAWVRDNFTAKKLGVPENWKDLVAHLTRKDLATIAGGKNVPRTFRALKTLSGLTLVVRRKSSDGKFIYSNVHWLDSFTYEDEAGPYDLRISPELLNYLINVERNFTTLNIGEAMSFRSKETQKMYEFIKMYSGNFRYADHESNAKGVKYAKNVIPVKIETLRMLFGLNGKDTSRGCDKKEKGKYTNYYSIRKNILKRAQQELYEHYKLGKGEVWFDFQEVPIVSGGTRRGIKVTTVYLYIYTKDHPKTGVDRPWQQSDPDLYPFVESLEEAASLTPLERMKSNSLMPMSVDDKKVALASKLRLYLAPDEVAYYMRKTAEESMKNLLNQADCYMNMIQVILDKEKQHRFKTGTKAFKRNCLVNFVFTKNLQQCFGWSIPQVNRPNHLRSHKQNKQLPIL